MTLRYGTFAKNFKAGAAAMRRSLNKQLGGYVAAREIEFIPFNASGRVGDPTYARISDLTGKLVEQEVRELLAQYPAATGVGVEIGFDAYESFGEYIQTAKGSASYDYEPRVDHYASDISRDEVA